MGSPVEKKENDSGKKKEIDEPPVDDTKNLFNFKHITDRLKAGHKKEILKTSVLELDYDCEP